MGYYRLTAIFFLFTSLFSPVFSAQNPQVVLETNFGDIVIELYPDDAPITVDNFLSYVNSDFYDGLLFHRSESRGRIVYGYNKIHVGSLDVIQGGACYYYESENGNGFSFPPTGPQITNESYNGLSNVRGTIAMARLGEDQYGNPQPDSATSQFFINHQNNLELDRDYPDGDGYGYCVFGQVVDGMDVVDNIASAQILDLLTIDVNWPPFHFFPNPLIGMYRAYILPCDVSYCSNLTPGSQIDFADFAAFASRWLDVCGSDNDFCDGSDLTYNGTVDIADLELFIDHWTRTAGYEPVFSDLATSGVIDLDDLLLLMAHWLGSGCDEENGYCGGADIDHTGGVDFTDFTLFSNNWLLTY